MMKCLNCEKYTMQWNGDFGTCTFCNKTYHKDEYQEIKTRHNNILNKYIQAIQEVTNVYSFKAELKRMQVEYQKYKSLFDEFEDLAQKGAVQQGRIIELEDDGIDVVEILLTNYRPPEVYTAAYKVRSTLEKWLKYERCYDPDLPIYPQNWDMRAKIFFNGFDEDFVNQFITIYRTMNIFIHQNIESIFRQNFNLERDKINQIRVGVEFIRQNSLFINNQLEGMKNLLKHNDAKIYDYIEKNIVKFYPSDETISKQTANRFNFFVKDINKCLNNQHDLIVYLENNQVQIPDLKVTKEIFRSRIKHDCIKL